MSIFFWRNSNKRSAAAERRQDKEQHIITMSGRDFGELFTCSAALKIWLPESTEKQLQEMSRFIDISFSDIVRQILFIHLYGRYDFLGYVERRLHTFSEPEVVECKMQFSICDPPGFDADAAWAELERELSEPPKEKPVIATRVCLPERMKSDLTALAEKKYTTVSSYCREVIITHLMGAASAVPESPIKDQEGFE